MGELKSKRKGHDHAFRLDLDASPLLGGKPKPTTLLRSMFATGYRLLIACVVLWISDVKFVLSVESAEAKAEWMRCFGRHAHK